METFIEVPEGVTEIGGSAFEGCELLVDENGFIIMNGILCGYYGDKNTVVIPDGVTKIGGNAFYYTAIYNDSSNWKMGVLFLR